MSYVPVYVHEDDLALVQTITAKLKMSPSPRLRSALTKALTTPEPSVAIQMPLTGPDGESLVPSPKIERHRGPDKDPRKTPGHPKTIEDYIMEHKGATVSALSLVAHVKKVHKVDLKVSSVSSILASLCRGRKISKFHSPAKGYHIYLIKPRKG